MIKGITFDLDGVYFLNGKTNFISSLKNLGVSEDDAKRVFLKSYEMNQLYKMGKMTDDEFWSWAIKEWGLNKSNQEIIDILIDGYEINEKVVEMVREIRRKGYKSLVCTNNFPARINGLDKRFGFLQDIDVAVFSYEVGAVKPTKEIFKKLINFSGLNPEEIVFADDDNVTVRSAHSLGINAFLYEGFDDFTNKLIKLGVT